MTARPGTNGGHDALPAAAGRVGLLGGSFNPAHSGHLHISRLALEILELDAVWWLVSPQNPLKPASEMAPLPDRLASARDVGAAEERVRVTAIEREMGTRYTVDTLTALKRQYPDTRFAWVMGADNLAEVHRWKDWPEIFARIPVAVFDRPTYSFGALQSPAARRFAGDRLGRSRARTLVEEDPPAWVFLWTAFDPASATAIREGAAIREETKTNAASSGAADHRR